MNINPGEYEAKRAAVAEAVRRALPVDRDDNTVYLGSKDGVPLWGHPSNVIEAIVAEVMQALHPAPPEGVAELRGRWGCGCDMSLCRLRWDRFSDAGVDPVASYRVVCITHSLVGKSMPFRVADNQGARAEAQALFELNRAHEEQCR